MNELKKLKEEINTLFISKGESREHSLNQEMLEVDGNEVKQLSLCGVGGVLGQIMICF